MNGGRNGVVAVGLIALAAVAGCGGGVTYAGSKVDSEVAFLGEIEQQFRDDAGRGNTNLGAGAHCWLLKDKDSGELDSLAACGPVRHLAATEPGVWDLYRFEASVEDDQVSVDDLTLDKTGASLPADREPYRGDDAKLPDSPEAVAAPEPPAAKPGTARIVPDAKMESVSAPPKGRLIAPGVTVEATQVGEMKTLPGDDKAPLYRAADGEEFRAIKVKVTRELGLDAAPTYIVKSGSAQTGIDLGKDPKATDGESVVVSVPKGQDADLVVTVAGLGQSLSIRTGDRSSTTAAAYYRQNTKTSVNKQYAGQQVKVGQFELMHQVTFTDVTVSPFDPQKGWAPAGKVWLEFGFTGANTDALNHARGVYDWNANDTGQLTATDDRGRKVPVTVPENLTGVGSDHGTFPVLVAEDVKWLDIKYGPLGTFAQEQTFYQMKPPSGSYTFHRMTFRVTVPQ